MTPDEARQELRQAEEAIRKLQSYLHAQFEGARGPLRDHCFGYSCGSGISACVVMQGAASQLRVSLAQVETAQRQMSASQ